MGRARNYGHFAHLGKPVVSCLSFPTRVWLDERAAGDILPPALAKIIALTGFPEWLPEQRRVAQRVLDQVRQKFELFGFSPIETRSVEPLDVLTKKGATDKEIYVLKRLHATEDED